MTRRLTMLFLLDVIVSACAGRPAAPSMPVTVGAIAGTWQGTIAFSTPTPITVPTTWTFTTLDQTGGHGFEVRATWMGITTTAMTATVIGSQFSTNGAYASPLGCDALVGGIGTAAPRVIDATFSGSSSCDAVFEGHLTLTR